MPNNLQARRRIGRAISDLLKVRENNGDLSSGERAANETAIRGLKDEYFALSGVSETATYAEITAALSGASKELKLIKDRREKFQNNLVTASKLLGSITSVLKLLA